MNSETSGNKLPQSVRKKGSAVLLVTELFPPRVGGSAVLFENIYSRLGRPVLVLTDTHTSESASPDEHDGPHDGLQIVRRPIVWPDWGILHPAGLRHYWRVASEIRALKPATNSLVHCARAVPEGLSVLLARQWRRFRYLCWSHGEEIEYARTSRELTFHIKRVYGAAEAVVANSRNTVERLVALGIPASKIHLVHPGVDVSRFQPGTDGSAVRRQFAPFGEVLLLSVGRLQRRKGHDLAIAAMRVLLESLPNLRYVIVGDGEERTRLEALVSDYGLSDRVAFVGEVPAEELPAYYAACDIFVLPNRAERDVEGFGIVFLEAAAAEKPVIGGSNGGVPDAVADGETGLLVSGTDVHELAAAIGQLARSREARLQLGKAGRARVLRLFSWDRAAAAVAELHARLEHGSA